MSRTKLSTGAASSDATMPPLCLPNLRATASLSDILASSCSPARGYFSPSASYLRPLSPGPASPQSSYSDLPSPSLSTTSSQRTYGIRRVPPPQLSPDEQSFMATYNSNSEKARSATSLPGPGTGKTYITFPEDLSVSPSRWLRGSVSDVSLDRGLGKPAATSSSRPQISKSISATFGIAIANLQSGFTSPRINRDCSSRFASPLPSPTLAKASQASDTAAYRFPYKLLLPSGSTSARTPPEPVAYPSQRKLSTAYEGLEDWSSDHERGTSTNVGSPVRGLFDEGTTSLAHEKKDSVDSNVDSIFDTYNSSIGSINSARTSIDESNIVPDKQETEAQQLNLEWQGEHQQMLDDTNHYLPNARKIETTHRATRSLSYLDELPGFPTGIGRASLPSGLFSTSPSSWPGRRRLFGKEKEEKEEQLPFNSTSRPTGSQLLHAADAMVYTENGDLVRFGDLWQGQRTIVCFIRHYWCPSCQDYMASIMRITPEQLEAHNLRLIVVGCGSWKMIPGYRKLLGGCTFPIVSDPTRAIYRQFGMTHTTLSPGKIQPSYVQHGNALNALVSLKRNLAMPLADPGKMAALGGEFVLGPGMEECSYSHRMRNTRDHAEFGDILKALGITLPSTPMLISPVSPGVQKEGSDRQFPFLGRKMKKEQSAKNTSKQTHSRGPSSARIVIRLDSSMDSKNGATTFTPARAVPGSFA